MKKKILAFADTRTTIELPNVAPDFVLLLGDIQSKTVSQIDRKYSCPKLGVFGNHCHPRNFDDTSIFNLHGKIRTIDGVTFAGFEGSPVYKDSDFGQHTDMECDLFVQQIANSNVDILLSHSNPSYGDMELDEAHRGFKAYNHLLLNDKLGFLFHGHLHDPFVRKINNVEVHSVYSYSLVTIDIPDK